MGRLLGLIMAAPGTCIGACVGMLGGPISVVIGGTIGSVVGYSIGRWHEEILGKIRMFLVKNKRVKKQKKGVKKMNMNELKQKLNGRIDEINKEINSSWDQWTVERLRSEKSILSKVIGEEY